MATARNFGEPIEQARATALPDPLHRGLRDELLLRRERLQKSLSQRSAVRLVRLLEEVDAALGRLEGGTYGICEACHEPIETERMFANPLACFCLDHMPPEQLRLLEADLELASRLQSRLLPQPDFHCDGWQVAYSYQPAGLVSGDYCDLISDPDNNLYFFLGDVSGKGIAASMLMANLSAMFRALVPLNVSLADLVAHANTAFCESTLPTQYATLLVGKATPTGEVEICNAGHLAPLVFTHDGVKTGSGLTDGASGFPIGLFCQQPYSTSTLQLAPGEFMLLYSDGVSEASNGDDQEYGADRLIKVVGNCAGLSPGETIRTCLEDVTTFRGDAPLADDQSVMVVQRVA